MAGRVLPATTDRLDDGNPQAGFKPANGGSRYRTDHVLDGTTELRGVTRSNLLFYRINQENRASVTGYVLWTHAEELESFAL